MHLFATSRNGVAAKELERALDTSYPTAWRMGHLIRKYIAETDGEWPLGGVVEADMIKSIQASFMPRMTGRLSPVQTVPLAKFDSAITALPRLFKRSLEIGKSLTLVH